MPKRLPEFFIVDMLMSIDVISRYMAKIEDAFEFVENEVVFIIVTRELEILGEATNNFLKDKGIGQLAKPTWRQVVDFRNIIQAHGGFAKIAKKSGLGRESLYKTLSEKGNPEFRTIAALTYALGLELRFI